MCFEFVKSKGDYDFISPTINFTLNAITLAVGGTSLGVITYTALKALGFNQAATLIATAIPTTIAAFGVAGTIAGGIGLLLIGHTIFNAFRR